MTLRERIEILAQNMSGEWWAEQIETILTETAAADAERDRLAEIGGLVEELSTGRTISITHRNTDTSGSTIIMNETMRGTYLARVDADDLLAALEALKEKVEGAQRGNDEG